MTIHRIHMGSFTNAFSQCTGPGIPSLAENVREIHKSWEMPLSAGATMIYPGHGKPFHADCLKKTLSGIRGRGSGIDYESVFDKREDAGDSGWKLKTIFMAFNRSSGKWGPRSLNAVFHKAAPAAP